MDLESFINNIVTFNNLDKIFNFLPKDIVNYIYGFAQEICDDCNNCCNTCIINCYYTSNCNRNKTCCITELEILISNYEKEKLP